MCRIGPGQEFVEAALGIADDDAADQASQIGPRLDADQLACQAQPGPLTIGVSRTDGEING